MIVAKSIMPGTSSNGGSIVVKPVETQLPPTLRVINMNTVAWDAVPGAAVYVMYLSYDNGPFNEVFRPINLKVNIAMGYAKCNVYRLKAESKTGKLSNFSNPVTSCGGKTYAIGI